MRTFRNHAIYYPTTGVAFMSRTVVQVFGYVLLAAFLGVVMWLFREQHQQLLMAMWFGVCMVVGVVVGGWLRRQRARRRTDLAERA
jgi:hypothetical protein